MTTSETAADTVCAKCMTPWPADDVNLFGLGPCCADSLPAWLDIVPAIPTDGLLPVIVLGEAAIACGLTRAIATETINPDGDAPEVRIVAYPNSYSGDTPVFIVPLDETRPDLDQRQGFGGALKHLWTDAHQQSGQVGTGNPLNELGDHRPWKSIAFRYLMNETTEEDKITVAKAVGKIA